MDVAYSNIPEDLGNPHFTFQATIINTLDPNEPAITVDGDQYEGETMFDVGGARFSFDPGTGRLLVSSPKTYSTKGLSLQTVQENLQELSVTPEMINAVTSAQ